MFPYTSGSKGASNNIPNRNSRLQHTTRPKIKNFKLRFAEAKLHAALYECEIKFSRVSAGFGTDFESTRFE